MSTKFRPITHIITNTSNSYKRYMWKWEGLDGYEGTMQISKLTINNISLPYTHILEYLYKGYDFGSQTSQMMINDETGVNAKWCCGGQDTDGWGYFIFDLDSRVIPNYYSLTTAGDNSSYSNRRPLNFYLYGTLDDNNTSADQGWILLHHGTKSMIPSGNNEQFTMNISESQNNLYQTIFRPITIFENIPEPPFPYQTVQIGDQIWMAENLHEDDGGTGIKTVQSVISQGYEFGPQTYYSYDAAVRVADSIDGWHLPTYSEWSVLRTNFDYQAANARSTTGWNNTNGTNTLGLNIQPLGRFENISSYNSPNALGEEANLWCYNVVNPSQGKGIFFYNSGASNWDIDWSNTHGNSVRLIKD